MDNKQDPYSFSLFPEFSTEKYKAIIRFILKCIYAAVLSFQIYEAIKLSILGIGLINLFFVWFKGYLRIEYLQDGNFLLCVLNKPLGRIEYAEQLLEVICRAQYFRPLELIVIGVRVVLIRPFILKFLRFRIEDDKCSLISLGPSDIDFTKSDSIPEKATE